MKNQSKLTRRAYLKGTAATSLAAMLATPAIAAAPDQIVMPYSNGVELGMPMMIAVAKGFAKEHGIEVTSFLAGPGTNIRANLIAKQFDFAALDWSHVPIARLAGSPFRAVLAITDRTNQSLIVRSTLKDKVHQVTDLKGMTIGCSAPGSSSWTYAKLALEKVGLQADRDYNLIVIGGDTGVVTTALETGRVDAVSAWEPITSLALSRNVVFPLVKAWDLQQQVEFYGSERLACLSLVTRDDVIQGKRDLVKRMVDTHVQALAFMHASTPEQIVETLFSEPKSAAMFQGLPREVLTTIVQRTKPAFGAGCISKAGFEWLMKRTADYKVVARPISFAEYADTSFVGECG